MDGMQFDVALIVLIVLFLWQISEGRKAREEKKEFYERMCAALERSNRYR